MSPGTLLMMAVSRGCLGQSASAEANELVNIWTSLVKDLEAGVELGSNNRVELWRVLRRFIPSANIVPYSELRNFYQAASTVLGGRVEGNLQKEVVDRLAHLLIHHETTKEAYEAAFSQIWSAYFIDSENRPTDLHDLKCTLVALQKEAA